LHNPISFTGLLARTTKADTTRAKSTQAQIRFPNRIRCGNGKKTLFNTAASAWCTMLPPKNNPNGITSVAIVRTTGDATVLKIRRTQPWFGTSHALWPVSNRQANKYFLNCL
jgi:hypothetical protein